MECADGACVRSESAAAAPARPLPAHVAVEVSGNVVRAGSARRRFREGDARSLLIAYLSLIRGLRDQRRARTIELRSADIESLARYLGRPGSEVVEQLADVMGATRSQRATMLTLFSTGALVIGLAGSTAVGRAESTPANLVGSGPAIEAVVPRAEPVVVLPASTTTPEIRSTTVQPTTSTTEPPAAMELPAPAPVEEPPTIVDPPAVSDAPRPRPDPSVPSAPTDATGDPAAPVPDPTQQPDDTAADDAATDDTVVTDIGTPPIPPTTDTPTDDTVSG